MLRTPRNPRTRLALTLAIAGGFFSLAGWGIMTARAQCCGQSAAASTAYLPQVTSSVGYSAGYASDCCQTAPVSCGPSYRLESRTVYDKQEFNAFRVSYDTEYEESTVTVYKPVWETENRERSITVRKPIVETSMREERTVTYKPVFETTYRDESYDVVKQVPETSEREEQYIVQKPVCETTMREERYLVARPVTETCEREQRFVVRRPVTESPNASNAPPPTTPSRPIKRATPTKATCRSSKFACPARRKRVSAGHPAAMS